MEKTNLTTEHQVAVHTTKAGVQVYVEPGNIGKNRWDFKVSHSVEEGDPYPVTHGDLVCETYRKGLAAGDDGFKALVAHLLDVIEKAKGVDRFPPSLAQFKHDDVARLQAIGLDKVGEYDLELFLVLFELVQNPGVHELPQRVGTGEAFSADQRQSRRLGRGGLPNRDSSADEGLPSHPG